MGKRITSTEKRKYEQDNIGNVLLNEVVAILANVYLWVIFLLMPLYVHDHYYEMAFHKWRIYLYATVGLLGVVLGVGSIYLVKKLHKGKIARRKKESVCNLKVIFQNANILEIVAVLYGISAVITLFICGYPRAAWLGTDSWYMGIMAQLLFVGTFLFFSRKKVPTRDVVCMNLIASGICYVIGILQRYGWDIFHYYYGMTAEVIRDYLSTIGNRTWYSGYVSVVFPIGVYFFWCNKNRKEAFLTGIYSFLAFAAIVTNNSDSIYLAVAAVFFGLFVMSMGSWKRIYRWLCVLTVWFGACTVMSVMRILPTNVRELRGLSRAFLDIRIAVGGLVVFGITVCLLRYVSCKCKYDWDREWKHVITGRIRKSICIAVIVAGVALCGVIIANTTGSFQKWFGFTIDNSYLLFDNEWGDHRGFNWKLTWRMFWELPFVQKLFGIGSDCYAFYAYSNPVYAGELKGYFGPEAMVANAHNEWLNALLCNGIVGSLLYIGLFLGVMMKCFSKSVSKQAQPFVQAIGLCVLGYITHNTFCYQQICATGPIFLLMGIATQKIRKGGEGQI